MWREIGDSTAIALQQMQWARSRRVVEPYLFD